MPLKSTRHTTKSSRGGKRDGAGRPYGTGKYGEATRAVRVPNSLVDHLQRFLATYRHTATPSSSLPFFAPKHELKTCPLPLYEDKVAAGFPSPAQDHIDSALDLNEYVIQNPASTFYVRVTGESMRNAGIYPNDLLVVDKALKPQDGHIIIAAIDGEFTVKRLKMGRNKSLSLVPENENYPTIVVTQEMDFTIWGVVTNVIHSCL